MCLCVGITDRLCNDLWTWIVLVCVLNYKTNKKRVIKKYIYISILHYRCHIHCSGATTAPNISLKKVPNKGIIYFCLSKNCSAQVLKIVCENYLAFFKYTIFSFYRKIARILTKRGSSDAKKNLFQWQNVTKEVNVSGQGRSSAQFTDR